MRGKEGKTLKKDTTHTIKRAQRFPVILIGEGLLVGAVGGLLVLLYRVALTYAGKWLDIVLEIYQGQPHSDRRMVHNPASDGICGWQTGKMGADDIRERYPPGGRGSNRKTNAELEKGAACQVCWRFSLPVRRIIAGKRRPLHPARGDGRTGTVQDARPG